MPDGGSLARHTQPCYCGHCQGARRLAEQKAAIHQPKPLKDCGCVRNEQCYLSGACRLRQRERERAAIAAKTKRLIP